MKQVYLSGPISGLTFDEADDWRTAVAAKLSEVGIRPMSPLRAKEYMRKVGGPLSATGFEYSALGVLSSSRGITTRDRFDCTTADVVLVNLLGAKRVSIGTVMEIAWADAHRIPIVCAIEPGESKQSAEERAWLAGLLDGEGCIFVTRRERKQRVSYTLQVRLCMTSEDTVREAHRVAGVGTVHKPKKLLSGKLAYTWTAMSREAANLLREIHPWLIAKKRSAAFAIALQNMMVPSGGRPYKDGRINEDADAERKRELYLGWLDAHKGVVGNREIPAVSMISSPHSHMILSEVIGFRVPTLEEAVEITKSILL